MSKYVVFAVLLGVFTWTLLEYVLHRFLGHDKRFRPNFFAKEHVRHHVEGNYFAPTWKKLIAASLLTLGLSALAALVVGPALGIAYVLGFMVSYGGYEVHHRREHTHAGRSAYGRWARRHHFYHHFVDGRSNHGVTSPLWDFVFGTYRKADKIPVPPRLCMEWLKDPLTGGIRERFADTFVLGRAGRHVEPPTE